MQLVQITKFLILVLFFLASCKKEKVPLVDCSNPTSDITKTKSIVVGSWIWAYEKYRDRISQSYIIKTPQTEGVTRHYNFLKNNDVRIYQNNNLVETASYEITTLNVVTGSDMDKDRTILLFKNKSTNQRTDFAPVRICNDTLTLNYQSYLDTKGQEKWYKN